MTELAGIELIKPDWPAPANIHGFTTTRNGGFSQGPWDSFNLGSSCGDDPQHVEKNRRFLSGLLPSEPRWLRQVHGASVVGWDKANIPGTEADAIVSKQSGQVCAVLTADCLPVLFCNRGWNAYCRCTCGLARSGCGCSRGHGFGDGMQTG